MKKLSTLLPIVAVLLALMVLAQPLMPKAYHGAYDLDTLARLPVSAGGRTLPFDSVARNSRMIVSDRQTAEIDGKHVDATVSVGVAVLARDADEDVASLFERADHALYAAKKRGRNRVEVAGRQSAAGAERDAGEARPELATVSPIRAASPTLVPQSPSFDDDIAWAEAEPLRAARK